MSKIPANYPINELTPYQILGASENDSITEINSIYKRLVMVLHPDKALTADAKRLGWSAEEKSEAFNQVRKAYKTILKERKESNVPDYNIDYLIDENLKQDRLFNQYNEFVSSTKSKVSFDSVPIFNTGRANDIKHDGASGAASKGKGHTTRDDIYNEFDIENGLNKSTVKSFPVIDKFNQDKFNEFFEHNKRKQQEDGFDDPFNRGYNDMFKPMSTEESNLIKSSLSRPDISVQTPSILKRPDMKDGRIVSYGIRENFLLSEPSVGYAEIGLSNVEDFSITVGGISSDCIHGSDLMAVYGQNYEYWEDSVKRDKNIYDKYNDTLAPEKKMNSHLSERSNLSYEPDLEIQREIDLENKRKEKLEELRKYQAKKEDNYYIARNGGRLNY